jgi:hypothetical protein
MKRFITCTLHQVSLGSEDLKRRDHSKDLDVDGRIDLREIVWEVVDLAYRTQDRGKWWALVNTVINLQVP